MNVEFVANEAGSAVDIETLITGVKNIYAFNVQRQEMIQRMKVFILNIKANFMRDVTV